MEIENAEVIQSAQSSTPLPSQSIFNSSSRFKKLLAPAITLGIILICSSIACIILLHTNGKSIKVLSLAYVLNTGEDTNRINNTNPSVTSHTYISSVNGLSKQEVNLGYTYNHTDNNLIYSIQITQSGKLLIRFNKSSIEIADSTNPTAFRTIIRCSCTLSDYLFSTDESKLAYIVKGDAETTSDKLYITDLSGHSFLVKIKDKFADTPLVKFNASTMQIALGAGGINGGTIQALQPQIITIDNQGNIKNKEMSENWDFLDLFSKDFRYIYLDTYTDDEPARKTIKKYDRQTKQAETIFTLPAGETARTLLMSPQEDKLIWFANNIPSLGPLADINSVKYYFYLINLSNKDLQKIALDGNMDSSDGYTNFWSPDGKFLFLYGKDGDSGYLFNLQTQKMTRIIQNKNKSYLDNSIVFLGWLNPTR
jgi:hypothetical protein